jgi:pyruvate/2-oxoglutarate dehydrogenase complex dihydrolipoamide acyltransferase (E2) component
MSLREIRLPRFPECWETCGSCGQGEVTIDDIRALPGERIERDDTLVVLETGKVALDIPAPCSGTIVELCVVPGQTVGEGELLAVIDADDSVTPIT